MDSETQAEIKETHPLDSSNEKQDRAHHVKSKDEITDYTHDVLSKYVPDVVNAHETSTEHSTSNVSGDGVGPPDDCKSGMTGEPTSKMDGRNKLILALCAFAVSLSTLSFSILSPFFPQEADRKGMSVVLTGLVFSVHPAVIFLTSPIYGTFLTKLGPKQVYLGGIFIGGLCTILFGLLDKLPGGALFAVGTVGCRSVGALGFSAFSTASFAIVSKAFRENMGLAFGILETGVGLGYVIGPALGGALYKLGGFGLSFFVVGFLVLINGILVFKILPKIDKVKETRGTSVFYLLRSPMIVVPMVSVFVGNMGVTTTDATLARHVESFGLRPLIIGLFFVILSFTHTIGAPFIGYVTEKKNVLAPLMIGGSFVCCVGFLILGPSVLLPFLPFRLWTVALGLVCIGISLGCSLIPTMKCMMVGAVELGLKDDIDTYALVSGLFVSVFCLGGIAGPLGVGSLVQEYGYPTAYTCVAMCNLCSMVVSGVYFTNRYMGRMMKKTKIFNGEMGPDKKDYTALE